MWSRLFRSRGSNDAQVPFLAVAVFAPSASGNDLMIPLATAMLAVSPRDR